MGDNPNPTPTTEYDEQHDRLMLAAALLIEWMLTVDPDKGADDGRA